jgi:hypothetical protein
MRPGSASNVESVVFGGVRLIRENGIAIAVEILSGNSIGLPSFVAFGKVSQPAKVIEKLSFLILHCNQLLFLPKLKPSDQTAFIGVNHFHRFHLN